MKALITLLSILFSLQYSFAQQDFKSKRDSVALENRLKADKLLSSLKLSDGPKLLFSIDDQYYYIITKISENVYNENFIHTNTSGNILENRSLRSCRKDRKFLLKVNPFDYSKYNTHLITEVPDAKYVEGKPSYFVVKDEKSQRYGEFSLSTFTIPSPINGNLYGYLIRKLSEEMQKDK